MSADTLFDLAEFEREAVAATAWDGAPLTYTTSYYSPAELDAAFERYRAEFGHFGCVPRSHMWNRNEWNAGARAVTEDGHELHKFHADTSCREKDHDHSAAPLPQGGTNLAVCPGCAWHVVTDTENEAVEAWHDHAMPGWRSLPVMPQLTSDRTDEKKARAAAAKWCATNYPAEWQRPGSPIRTDRGPHQGRHVEGRSPFGGYDLAANN